MENFHTKAVLIKPIVIGCTILEFVKLAMYEFYYDCLLPTFGDKDRLWFTDTDSFICHVQSEDLVGKLGIIADRWLDTSNFECEHPLYSNANFRSLGKFKSETSDVPPIEFSGLRSKMYSLAMLSGEKFHKAKGMPKAYMRKHVDHDQYLVVCHLHIAVG